MPLALFLLAFLPQFPESAVATERAAEAAPFVGYALERRPLPQAARTLSRVARPSIAWDAVGTRSFLVGVEDGAFEAWVWPWQVLHDARLSYRAAKSDAFVELGRSAEAIEVRPDATTITYSSADARVELRAFCPDDEPVAFLWLALDVDAPGTLRVSFRPRLQPQWPAAVGGVAGRFDARFGAFVLSEPSARVAALVGSPWAARGSAGAQYDLADGTLRFECDVNPARAKREWLPIAIVATDGAGAPQRAEELYARALRSAAALAERHAIAWNVRAASFPIADVVPELDDAFFWNAVSLRQGLVRSAELGDGVVAGYGPAGATSQRPGFAWFFSGDVGWNARGFLDANLSDVLATGLDFARRHQRADGKLPHEVVLSAHLCDWFARYPFAYIHGDTTGLWIHACRELVQRTGDRAFLDRSWSAIVAAYRWIRAQDGDGDGLPDNALAGMGASEVGALRAKLATDVHLASASAVALADVAELAALRGDDALAAEARLAAERARTRLATGFWDSERGELAHALLADGSVSKERTPWPAEAVFLRLVDGEHALATMRALGGDDVTTPWGVRFLSRHSAAYDPKGYNEGAVWPFLTGIAALGDFETGRADEGWAKLVATARLSTSEALGRTPEVLSGARARSLDAAVPHQLFSSAAVVAPLVSGVFGYEADALAGRIVLRPSVPAVLEGRRITLRRLAFGAEKVDVELHAHDGVVDADVRVYDGLIATEFAPKVELRPRRGRAGDVRVRSR
ncbi:MAG: hypothetical protein IPJ77_17380 [Planctomycetes bacterium]|nr:hypothetical protein [Planctomycetota bacterium]